MTASPFSFLRPYFKRRNKKTARAAGQTTWTPPQLGAHYSFPNPGPKPLTGIALIELGGGYTQADIDATFQAYGLPSPTVTFVSIGGATNTPDGPDGAQGEVMLDIACAGGATLGKAPLYVVTGANTTAAFVAAIQWAANSPDLMDVSISWGGPENSWSSEDAASMEAALASCVAAGKNVFVAAGDTGSSDGETGSNVDFPGSSLSAIDCGGTSTPQTGPAVVWNDGTAGGATGGGVSELFSRPAFQASVAQAIPGSGRGCPDVASNADPDTGFPLTVAGQAEVYGGTSAAAPMWAALSCLMRSVGAPFTVEQLYANPTAFTDITSGNNGTYIAKTGYDLCTGLGTPVGTLLVAGVSGTGTAPPPPPPPPGTVLGTIQNPAPIPAWGRVRFKTPFAIPAGPITLSM